MAFGDDAFHGPAAIAAMAAALLIQVGTNYANDYFDFIKGADTEDRVGPTRATQAGLVSPVAMRNAFLIVFGLVVIPTGFLMFRAGWPVFIIALVSVISGALYTGGPKPLGYIGLGDLFVVVFFGPVAVGGTYFVQTLTINSGVLIAGLSPGLLATAILVVNNLRDIQTDTISGKRTLAVRFGPLFTRWEFVFTLVVASAIPIFLAITHQRPWSMLAACVLVPALPIIRRVWTDSGADLDPNLGKTSGLLIAHSLLFSLGWIA